MHREMELNLLVGPMPRGLKPAGGMVINPYFGDRTDVGLHSPNLSRGPGRGRVNVSLAGECFVKVTFWLNLSSLFSFYTNFLTTKYCLGTSHSNTGTSLALGFWQCSLCPSSDKASYQLVRSLSALGRCPVVLACNPTWAREEGRAGVGTTRVGQKGSGTQDWTQELRDLIPALLLILCLTSGQALKQLLTLGHSALGS